MRAVIDTNVFMSGIFWKGTPHNILQAWISRRFTIVFSAEIFQEYNRILEDLNKKYPRLENSKILEILSFYGEMVTPNKLPMQVCTDPDDDKFIAAAVFAKVKFIVTGDKALLNVNGYNEISFIKPAEFLKYLN